MKKEKFKFRFPTPQDGVNGIITVEGIRVKLATAPEEEFYALRVVEGLDEDNNPVYCRNIWWVASVRNGFRVSNHWGASMKYAIEEAENTIKDHLERYGREFVERAFKGRSLEGVETA